MGGFFDYFGLTRNLQNKVDTVAGQLAKGLNGRLETGGFWKGMPTVDITRKDIPVQVTFYNGGAKMPLLFTRFTLHRTSRDDFHMRIYNQGALSRLLKKFGLQGTGTGDPEFDGLFVVKSNGPELAKRLLDSKTRHSIKILYENQQSRIYDMADVPDAVKRRAADKDMGSAMKIIELFFTPSRPTFEIRYDEKRLCLDVFGLINQVEKAEALLDGLLSIYCDWQLSRP